jgi:hypothetical protein
MKKLFALILAVAMLATMSVAVFAEETAAETGNQESTNITYSVAPTYTVTIPPAITIDETEKTISAENVVVEKGQYVSIAIATTNNFVVTTDEGATLTYTVLQGEDTVDAGDEILAVNPANGKTGSTTIIFDIDETSIQYAGLYKGSVTFTISVKDVPNS